MPLLRKPLVHEPITQPPVARLAPVRYRGPIMPVVIGEKVRICVFVQAEIVKVLQDTGR